MDLEKKILTLIENDAKMSIKTIATILDMEESRVAEILAKLEKDKVILGYSTIIDWDINRG